MKKGLGWVFVVVGWPVLYLLGFIIYIWSIIIAFFESGFIASIITGIIPVLAQLYWGFKAWSYYGFNNLYVWALILYGGLWVFRFVGLYLLVDDDESKAF